MAYLNKGQLKAIFEQKPADITNEQVIESLVKQGHTFEGQDMLPKQFQPKVEKGNVLARAGQGIANLSGIGGMTKAVAGAGAVLQSQDVLNQAGKAGDVATDLIKQARALPQGSPERKQLLEEAKRITNLESERVGSLEKDLEQAPTPAQAVGSTAKTALNVATLGGAGVGANLTMNVLKNAAIGAGLGATDEIERGGSAKDALKSGVAGAVIGGSIPIVTNIIARGARALPSISQMLEKVNLRLTPPQKAKLGEKIDDVTSYLSKNKVVGTPEQRFNKVNKIYESTEEKLQSYLANDLKGRAVTKDAVIKRLTNLKKQFAGERDVIAIERQIDSMIDTIQTRYPSTIRADKLNYLKRSTYENAFNRAGDKVLDDVEFAMGDTLKDIIELIAKGGKTGTAKLIDGKTLQQFNKDYGTIINARKLLRVAAGRNQLGAFGRLLSSVLGGSIGLSTGGPVGAGVGAIAGERVGQAVFGTLPRSVVGASLRSLSDLPITEQAVQEVGSRLGTPLLSQ